MDARNHVLNCIPFPLFMHIFSVVSIPLSTIEPYMSMLTKLLNFFNSKLNSKYRKPKAKSIMSLITTKGVFCKHRWSCCWWLLILLNVAIKKCFGIYVQPNKQGLGSRQEVNMTIENTSKRDLNISPTLVSLHILMQSSLDTYHDLKIVSKNAS